MILGSLPGPPSTRAIDCSNRPATPKKCSQTVGQGEEAVCVPENYECCNTRLCAAACGASMAKKLGRFAKSARRSPFGTVPGIE